MASFAGPRPPMGVGIPGLGPRPPMGMRPPGPGAPMMRPRPPGGAPPMFRPPIQQAIHAPQTPLNIPPQSPTPIFNDEV